MTSIPIRSWSAAAGDSITVLNNRTKQEKTVYLAFVGVGNKDTDIWTIGQMLMMVNAAIKAAQTGVGITTEAPSVSFDSATTLFTFYLPSMYCDGTSVALYTTYSVARLFANMGGANPKVANFLSPPKEFQISCEGATTTGSGRRNLVQEFPSLYAWSDITGITLKTSHGDIDLVPHRQGVSRAPFVGSVLGWFAAPDGLPQFAIRSVVARTTSGLQRAVRLNAGDFFRVDLALR